MLAPSASFISVSISTYLSTWLSLSYLTLYLAISLLPTYPTISPNLHNSPSLAIGLLPMQPGVKHPVFEFSEDETKEWRVHMMAPWGGKPQPLTTQTSCFFLWIKLYWNFILVLLLAASQDKGKTEYIITYTCPTTFTVWHFTESLLTHALRMTT